MPPRSNGQSTLVDPHGRPFQFGYDAVEDDAKKRRRPAQVRLLSEDKHLTPVKRKKLTATGRDLIRNYTVCAFMIRKHTDYVARFNFAARTPNEAFNQRLEELVKWWGRKQNFDVAGRHSLHRYIRLNEARRTLDGDVFTLKLSSGRVQAIEGDRIRTPTGGGDLPQNIDPTRVTHGVITTKAGRPKGYCLHSRSKLGEGFEFDRIVPARHMLPHGYYDRFDQVRGIGLIAPGINTLQDTYEGLTYGVAKAKLAQLWGLKVKHAPGDEEAIGDLTTTTSGGELDKSASEVDFGRGPFQLDLELDEDAEIMESRVPPTEFQEFMKLLIMISLKAVDIPYSFFDEKHTNYSGQRQAWLLYDQSAEEKREDNREQLDSLMAWRIGLWILDGVLIVPKSLSIEQVQWEWIALGIPWLQPHQEVKADSEAVDRGFTSTARVCKRRGLDAYELVDEEAAFQAYRQKKLQEAGLDKPDDDQEDDDAPE